MLNNHFRLIYPQSCVKLGAITDKVVNLFKHNIPFNPKNLPFYYGYIIVPAAILGMLMSIPGQTAGFSAFTEPLLGDLKIDRSTLAMSYFLGTMTSGLLLPKGGIFLDTFGTRVTIFLVSLCFGLVLTVFSFCQNILSFLESSLSFLDRQIIYVAGLSVLILGIRFFGQGMLPVISNTMISRWFDKYRGKVVAVMGVVNSLCFNAAPFIMATLVGIYTWQGTWQILALIAGLVFLIFSWVIFRDSPESCGLEVDGIKNGDEDSNAKKEMTGMTIEEAKKTLNFKVVTLVLGLYGMTLTGITFHLEAIGIAAGLSKAQAMSIFIPVSFITIPIGFTTAYISDKLPKKILVLILCLTQASAYLCFSFQGTAIGYYLTIVFLGLSGGMFGPIMAIAYPWFFGRKHLGAINGKANSIIVIFSAIGPLIFSLLKDLSSSFNTALYVCAIFPVILFFIGLKMTSGKMYEE